MSDPEIPPRPSWFAPAARTIVVRYRQFIASTARFSPTERQRLFGLTVLIGGVCGLVAVAFHQAIRWVEALTIDRAFAAEEWIPWVLVVPIGGALLAGIGLSYLPGARGSGIPQVKIAYASAIPRLRLRDAFGKFAICVVQVGTGSSLGREGPTVQICSGVALGIGRLGGVASHNLKLLLPVGTAAGIAAAFNAPIAAVTFTIEEIVGKLDQTLLSGVIVAAALAAVVERSILGESPVFAVPAGYGLDHPLSLVTYVALGIAAALVAVAFTDSLLWLRARFAAWKSIPVWGRPAVGALLTASLAIAVMLGLGVAGITGVGYTSLLEALSGDFPVKTLLVLGAVKLVATVCSYSSGGAGGIFAPSLFIGAMLGGAFGSLDVELFGHGHSEVGSFALVGMGAVFAATIRAPITSVLIIIEMTGGYGLTLPLMISNMIAYVLARRLRHLPIYEALLAQDGIDLQPPQREMLDGITLDRLEIEQEPHSLAPADPASRVIQVIAGAGRQEIFPVLDGDGRLAGMIALDDLSALASETDLDGLVCAADLMRPAVALRPHDLVQRALELMGSLGVRQLPVIDLEDRVIGVIDEATIAREVLRALATRKRPNSLVDQ